MFPTVSIKKFWSANIKGIFWEIITIVWYILANHEILAWRYKTKLGEIDLVTSKGGCLFFTEVKYRKSGAEDCYNPNQRIRLAKAVAIFKRRFNKLNSPSRGVFIVYLPWPKVKVFGF